MSNSEQQTSPPFTAEQIYTLVDRLGNDEDREALAHFFDSMPINHGGVAVYETDRSEEDEALLEAPLICFNGQLDNGDVAGLRQADEGVTEFTNNKHKPSLSEHQKEAKQPVKSLPKRLGAISLSGVAGGIVGALMDVLVPEGEVALDTTIGVLSAVMIYLGAWPFAKQRQLQNAKQLAESLKARCLDAEQGAIRFLRDRYHLYDLPAPQKIDPASAGNEPNPPTDTLTALWDLTTDAKPSYAIYGNIEEDESRQMQILPGQLIKAALINDESPGIFWSEYLGEQARELSSLDSQIESVEAEIGHLERIKTLAGHTDEEALERYKQELQTHRHKMVEKTYEIVQQAEERAEIRRREAKRVETEEFFNKAASGEVDEAHDYELALQALRSIVLNSLNDMDLADPSTLEVAKGANVYLQGVRHELRSMKEMPYFYTGLHEQFSKRLPNLPKWEDVEKQFRPQLGPEGV